MLQLVNHGSICLIKPSDDDADRFWEWTGDHIVADVTDENIDDHTPLQTWNDGLVVESNYAADLLNGLRSEGFKIC